MFDYTTITPLNTNYALETIKYTYSNSDKDQLTGYNGATCSYDANGNPTVYRGKNMAWMRGRLLQNYNGATYSYNAEGIRTGKSGVEFILDGDKVIAEKIGGTVNKRYFYDGTGIAGMEYGGAKYYFRKNLQGDVVGILNSSGTLLGTYVYDAWGKVLSMGSATIFTLNPFRYRGYYYDNETGFYYLNSRYYDPETGRFINPDTYSYIEPEKLGGLNLYVYCDDNPVSYCDPSGHIAIGAVLLSMLFGAVLGGLSSALLAQQNGLAGWNIVAAAAGGAVMGAATSGAFMLGGAAATVGLTVKGFTLPISWAGLYAIATYGTVAASVFRYYMDSIAYGYEASIDGYMESVLMGVIEGSISFFAGAIAGEMGLFKHVNKPSEKYKSFGLLKFSEKIQRALAVNLPAWGIRAFFRFIFPWLRQWN